MIINYEPGHFPNSSEIIYLCLKHLDGQIVLDFLKSNSQVLCVIPCEDGVVIVMRDTKGGAMPPYNVRETK